MIHKNRNQANLQILLKTNLNKAKIKNNKKIKNKAQKIKNNLMKNKMKMNNKTNKTM